MDKPRAMHLQTEKTSRKAMDKQRMRPKNRNFGSSYWKKREGRYGSMEMCPILEEQLLFPSEIMKKIQDFFQEHDENKNGIITRVDMQKLKEEGLPWSTEELELVFDGLDSDCQGYLTIQEFIAGLRHVLSSQTVTRRHRKRKGTLLKAPASLSQEEADTEQQKCFEAFINQLGADSIFEDQSEIWTIWVHLQQDESHLLGNLKELLAKMAHLIKEAKHAKKKLQLMLNTRVADHNKEVQQLYEEMEQQIEREKKRLQKESEIRSQIYTVEMQKVLDVKEREIQHFLGVQKELEKEFSILQEKQHKASTKNQQLKQANLALENQLQQALHQLQKTQRHWNAMKKRASQMLKEGGREGLLEEVSSKTPPAPQDENEMVTSELKMSFDYRLDEDTLDSSVEPAPEVNASTTKIESEPRTRVISNEQDSLAEFTEEKQHLRQEPLGQSSLLRELNDAIAALSKVPESLQQQMHDLDSQGQESSDQIRQGGNNQHSITQEKIPQYEALFRNDGPGKRILEIDQGILQQESLCKGQSYVQDDVLEMKKTNICEPRMDFKALVSMQRGIVLPEVYSHGHSKLTSQVSDPKDSPLQKDIPSLGQVTQPKLHKEVLKMRERIQTQWPSFDYEQGTVKKKSMERETGKEMLSVKGMLPVCFPSRTVQPKMHVEDGTEISLVHNSQIENVSKSETQIQTPEEREELLAEETSEDTKDVCPYPEHLYNVLFVGDSNVGKTSFLCRLHDDSFRANLSATIGMDYRVKNLLVDNKCFALRLWDTAGQERYHSVTKQFFRKADGVVLMYDITSEKSFADVQYWLNCIKEGAGNGVVILLLGNKTDYTAHRRVSVQDGSCLAKEYGLSFYECSAASGHNVFESMVKLVSVVIDSLALAFEQGKCQGNTGEPQFSTSFGRKEAVLLKAHEDQLKQKILDLPAIPTKKRGCCS